MISNSPIILSKWSPYVSMTPKDVTKVPVWIKLHKIPLVAYSKDGLSLIATQVRKPIMLDAFTSSMCNDPWGGISYARALVEISAGIDFKTEVSMVVPNEDGEGYTREVISVEYEWKPPHYRDCKVFGHTHDTCPNNVNKPDPNATTKADHSDGFTEVKRKKRKGRKVYQQPKSRNSGGDGVPKPKPNAFRFNKPRPNDYWPKQASDDTDDANIDVGAEGGAFSSTDTQNEDLDSDEEVDELIFSEGDKFDIRLKGCRNMSHVMDFTILENIEASIDSSLSQVVFGRPFVEITKLLLDKDGIKEVTFKTLYRESELGDLTSEARDLLSSRMIHSKDDYRRGCERASDLESGFYMDMHRFGPLYKKEIERVNLDASFKVDESMTSEGGVTELDLELAPTCLIKWLSMITWVRWQCSQNISWVSKGKGLLGPNGGSGRKFEGGFWGKVRSCGSNGGSEGSMFVIGGRGGSIVEIGGGSLVKRSMELNDGLGGVENKSSVGSKFMASGEECLDGWVGAGRGEVKGGGVVFGVSRILLGVIPKDIMGESSGEVFRLDGGAD
ncbi:mitochondrial outer membrane protein porin 2-like protein [Tanacetum coccineum]